MRFLGADGIFNGQEFLPEGMVLALSNDGTLEAVLKANEVDKGNTEMLEGILMPGFVNCHCHLELSHLLGKIPKHSGLPEFAKQVILKRNAATTAEIEESMAAADQQMWNNGIVAVGDISNGPVSFSRKSQSHIFYHTFIELIGLHPANADVIFEKGTELFQQLKDAELSGSLAPHAPYSTSLALIQKIAKYNFKNNSSFSIHNQESEEETKFFMGQKNNFDDLYAFLKLDMSWFKAPMSSSLHHYANSLTTGRSILVHNRVTEPSDMLHLKSKDIYWCFCPNANLYIENALPDFAVFGGQKDKICLGTDSLASNDQLNLVTEANKLLGSGNIFSLKDILKAMTYNGAMALGIEDKFGHLTLGNKMEINLIDHTNSEIRFIKKIT